MREFRRGRQAVVRRDRDHRHVGAVGRTGSRQRRRNERRREKVDQGSSANTVSENGSYSGKTFVSTGDNENALRIDGATVDFDNITVDKSAGATSNAENGDFYGVNAAILATNGATVTIKKSTVTSATRNGNGVFSYGKGINFVEIEEEI